MIFHGRYTSVTQALPKRYPSVTQALHKRYMTLNYILDTVFFQKLLRDDLYMIFGGV